MVDPGRVYVRDLVSWCVVCCWRLERKSGVWGERVSACVDLGRGGLITQQSLDRDQQVLCIVYPRAPCICCIVLAAANVVRLSDCRTVCHHGADISSSFCVAAAHLQTHHPTIRTNAEGGVGWP